MTEACMLTTVDNPYNPFNQFDQWYAFDTQKGYNTCAYLERVVGSSTIGLDLEESNSIVNHAIDEIIRMNVIGIYKKVERNS